MPESDARSVEYHSTLIGVSSGWRQANSHRPAQPEVTLKFLAEQEEVGKNPVEE